MQNKKQHQMLPTLTYVLLLLSPVTAAISASSDAVLRLELTHVDAGRGFTKRELMQRMLWRARARTASRLRSKSSRLPVSAPVTPGLSGEDVTTLEYVVHLAIGTPPQPVALTLDTGSDLIWTQCAPCFDCFDQVLPPFDASASKTFSLIPCSSPLCQKALDNYACSGGRCGSQGCIYFYSYGDHSVTVGDLAKDTITLSRASAPHLSFGCGLWNNGLFQSNETGIAGFARGSLSLPSQLRVGNFSYCFTSALQMRSGTVLLGLPAGSLSRGAIGRVQSTPFVRNPSLPSFYFLAMTGITVGATRLPIPASAFALKDNGRAGGTIIDSGTSISMFPKNIYNVVTASFKAHVALPVANASEMLCFKLPPGRPATQVDVPKLVFHFQGADMELPRENYVVDDPSAGLCLVLNSGGDQTFIGNFQQQNMHVVYDTANGRLWFAPARCEAL